MSQQFVCTVCDALCQQFVWTVRDTIYQQFVTLCMYSLWRHASTVCGIVYEVCDAIFEQFVWTVCDAMCQQFVTLCWQFASTVYGTVYEQCVTPCINSLWRYPWTGERHSDPRRKHRGQRRHQASVQSEFCSLLLVCVTSVVGVCHFCCCCISLPFHQASVHSGFLLCCCVLLSVLCVDRFVPVFVLYWVVLCCCVLLLVRWLDEWFWLDSFSVHKSD